MSARLARRPFKNLSMLLPALRTGQSRVTWGNFKGGAVGSRLEFRILGPLEVQLNGAPVRVGGPKQRALLAVLLCHANRVVSRDQLIDELLGDQPAGSADSVLHVQVSRLRKALAGGDAQPR